MNIAINVEGGRQHALARAVFRRRQRVRNDACHRPRIPMRLLSWKPVSPRGLFAPPGWLK